MKPWQMLTCVTPEWRQSTQQDVQHNTQAPHVGLMGVVLLKHLRCHIVGAAHNVAELLTGLEVGAQAKVSSFDQRLLTAISQEEVLWLDVPVHHSCRKEEDAFTDGCQPMACRGSPQCDLSTGMLCALLLEVG